MSRDPKPTIYEVARRAGVSRQTVSRVINNRPDVASDTRERILRIIEELNYRPSAIARSLSKQRTHNFGLVTSGLEYLGPSVTLSGIVKKSEQLGYGLFLKELPRKELSKFSIENVRNIINWFLDNQVDGIIWAVPEIASNRYWVDDLINDIHIPIIFLTSAKRKKIPTIAIDNYYGARLATKHLLECGRKAIGHISGPLDWWEAKQRFKGWQDTLIEAGIEPGKRMVVEGNWSSKSGKEAFMKLRKTFPEMDSIFIANDQMSLGVLQTACDEKIDIPNSLSIVGFDGTPESEYYTPSLTTISQDLEKLGCIAIEELAHVIDEEDFDSGLSEGKDIKIQPELIIRKSSSLMK